MANLSVNGTPQDLGFSNSNTSWVTTVDTTGKTWVRFTIHDFTDNVGVVAQITFAKYNGRDILPQLYSNPATANRVAGVLGSIVVVLGSDAGNNNLELKWSSGNFLDAQAVFGIGDIDSAGIDVAYVTSENSNIAGTCVPTPLTPSSDNALPFFSFASQGLNGTIVALANCTKNIGSGLDSGVGSFSCPLSSPAGTPTSATLTQGGGNNGHNLVIASALKPQAAAGSVGATTGAGTAAATGASTFAGVGAASGVGTAAAVGRSTFAAVATTSGVGTAAATSSSGTNTLSLTNNVPYFLGGNIYNFKQVLATTTDVVVAGLYAGGTPTHIEYQLGGSGSYATVNTELISGGAWSGKILAVAAGDTTLKLRWSNDVTANLTTLLSVAINILVIGDSEALDPNTSAVTPSGTPFHVRYLHNDTTWVDWDTTPEFEQGQWAYFGEQVTAGQSAPCFILNKAVAGSAFANWGSGQADLNAAISVATAFFNGGIHGVMMANTGTNDARQSSTLTAAGVKTTIDSICTAVNAVLPGGAAPIYWTAIAEVDTNIGGGNLRTEMDAVRGGLVLSVAGGACRMGPFLQDLDYTFDNLHPDTNDLPIIGRRQYLEISDTLFGTSVGYGPRVSSLTLDVTKLLVLVTLDRAMSNSLASSVVGFQVSDSGTPVTILTQVVTTSTSITLTLASAIVGTCTVTWTSNNDATGQTVPMRPTETLPTGATVTRPMELFFNQATVASGVAVGIAVGMATVNGSAGNSIGAATGAATALGIGASTFAAVAAAAGHATVRGDSGGGIGAGIGTSSLMLMGVGH